MLIFESICIQYLAYALTHWQFKTKGILRSREVEDIQRRDDFKYERIELLVITIPKTRVSLVIKISMVLGNVGKGWCIMMATTALAGSVNDI